MNLHPTFQHCLSRQNAMVDLLRTLVNLESPSGNNPCLFQFSHALATAFKEIGGVAPTLLNTGHGPILRVEAGQGPHPVLFLLHMDTVYDEGTLRDFPFRLKDDTAYGPGVLDMKSGIVQTIFALRMMQELYPISSVRWVILCTPDEESGSPSSRRLIEEEAKKSLCVLIPEPAAGVEGNLKTSRKGVSRFKLVVKGRPAHAGLNPLDGASAIQELAHQINRLYEMARPEEGLFVNVGVIRGGTHSNVVAAEAQADIDVRITTRDQANGISRALSELIPRDKRIHLTIEGGLNRPPMERTQGTERLFHLAGQAAKDLGFIIGETHVGGGSDGNFTSALGIPTLDGLGAVGAGAHTAGEERIVNHSLPQRTALLIELVRAIAGELRQGEK
jgi:glutamate carboxypeptidase